MTAPARAFLDLIKRFCEYEDGSEAFHVGVVEGTLDDERSDRQRLSATLTSIVSDARTLGVSFGDIIAIIPKAFATTSDDRWFIYAELEKEYG